MYLIYFNRPSVFVLQKPFARFTRELRHWETRNFKLGVRITRNMEETQQRAKESTGSNEDEGNTAGTN